MMAVMSKPFNQHQFTFRFLGRKDGWYAFRAPTWKTRNRKSMDAWRFQNAVSEWLMENTDSEWHFGNGNRVTGVAIAFATGNALCLLLKGAGDVVRFEQDFTVRGIEPGLAVAAGCGPANPLRGWMPRGDLSAEAEPAFAG